jgi:hypothetical protein
MDPIEWKVKVFLLVKILHCSVDNVESSKQGNKKKKQKSPKKLSTKQLCQSVKLVSFDILLGKNTIINLLRYEAYDLVPDGTFCVSYTLCYIWPTKKNRVYG